MKDFLKWLQLASSIPVHSFVFRIHLVDPKFLPYRQEHGVLIPDLLEESHGHVGHLVPGAIEVGTDGLLQVGPGRYGSETLIPSSRNIACGIFVFCR